MSRSTPASRSRRGCKHSFPPAPQPLPATLAFWGTDVPPELEAVGCELWLTARRFRDWAETPVADRWRLLIDTGSRSNAELLHAAYEEAPAIAPALARVAPLSMHMLSPDVGELSHAFREIAEWCESLGLLDLGIFFADAETALAPTDPAAANLAGRISREGGHWRRAEVLFNRAVGLANAVGDDDAKARAYLGWGTLKFRLGDFESARKFYNRAGNLLRSGGEKSLAGEVFHDVMLMSIESGSFGDAIKYAHRAFRWYPVHHERIPRAVHDFALLLIWQSYFTPAVPLLERAAEHIEPPNDRALIWSTLARAAGGAGGAARFAELSRNVIELLRHHDRYAPAALINLAFGAYALGETGEAESLANEGLRLAELRPTFKVEERVALQLLNSISSRVPPPVEQRLSYGSTWPEGRSLPEVIERAARVIQGWRGPTWRRKHQAGVEARGRI